MAAESVLFIDANQYLNLYGLVKGKRLLDALEEQKSHVFVTAQIVEEVHRNKLHLARAFLFEQFKKIELTQIAVPDHLLGISEEKTKELRKRLLELRDTTAKIKADLLQLVSESLTQISRSEDEVSRRLKRMFDGAAVASSEEMQCARERRERGNPPGKPEDPLGDQLSWEQFLTRCKAAKRVWIITKDKDFFTKHGNEFRLNALLYLDLARVMGGTPEVYCFDNLLDGLTHFAQNAGVTAEKLPTADEAKEIKKEQQELPPLGWLNNQDAANIAVQQANDYRRRARAAIIARGQGGWHPGMVAQSTFGWLDNSDQDVANIIVQQNEQRRRAMAAIIVSEQSGWHPGMVQRKPTESIISTSEEAKRSATSFLVNESQADIERFRPVFDEAVARAKEIAQNAGVTFYDITEVRFYSPDEGSRREDALWIPDDGTKTAHIAIRRIADPECLTHEVGHSFFHPSPLHDRNHEDPQYGDKFCNGFRYVVHPEKGKDWMPNDGGPYDAHALVLKCPDLNAFSAYFVQLCVAKRQNRGKRILDGEGI